MTVLLAVGCVVFGTAFVAAVRRHERAEVPVGPFSRAVVVEGLLLAPAIGCAVGAIVGFLLGSS